MARTSWKIGAEALLMLFINGYELMNATPLTPIAHELIFFKSQQNTIYNPRIPEKCNYTTK